MRRKLSKIVIGVFSLFLVFVVVLNISFGSFQKDKTNKKYNEEYETAYAWSEKSLDEQYSSDYKGKMYVSAEDKNWLISDYENGVSINKYLGSSKEVTIPETLDGKKVLRIDCNYIEQPDDPQSHDGPNSYDYYHCAFDNTDIEAIVLPSGIKEICYGTFSNVSSSEKPTLKRIVVDKENATFYSNNDGELFIKENDETVYGYNIEQTYYRKFSRVPGWMFFIYNLIHRAD